ncbi:MAG: hypothetical protein WKF75_09485 [Singulisphaera sp.]
MPRPAVVLGASGTPPRRDRRCLARDDVPIALVGGGGTVAGPGAVNFGVLSRDFAGLRLLTGARFVLERLAEACGRGGRRS